MRRYRRNVRLALLGLVSAVMAGAVNWLKAPTARSKTKPAMVRTSFLRKRDMYSSLRCLFRRRRTVYRRPTPERRATPCLARRGRRARTRLRLRAKLVLQNCRQTPYRP